VTNPIVGRLRLVNHPASFLLRGFDAEAKFEFSADSRVRIGRGADLEISITNKDNRSVLGGHTSYIIASTDGAWTITHTGHVGRMSVDDEILGKGPTPLQNGSRVELLNCDNQDVALAFTFELDA
jgi:hypothetical protein